MYAYKEILRSNENKGTGTWISSINSTNTEQQVRRRVCLYISIFVEFSNWQNESMELEVWRVVTISGSSSDWKRIQVGFLGADNFVFLTWELAI